MDPEHIFRALAGSSKVTSVPKQRLVDIFENAGISVQHDPRLRTLRKALGQAEEQLSLGAFCRIASINVLLLGDCLNNDLIVQEWQPFCDQVKEIYNAVEPLRDGHVASYIPQLARVDPELFAVTVCTVSGQQFHIGPTDQEFSVQSVSKTFNYCLAQMEFGEDKVHRHVGREPSGKAFNELIVMDDGRAHNPYINSGAMTTVSLVKPDLPLSDRFDYVLEKYSKLAGGQKISFSNATYLSEKATADRNFALCYLLKDQGAFPDWITGQAKLEETVDFYFQLCSVELSCQSLGVMAGALANGGICPTTGEKVLDPRHVANALSLMYTCGMYDHSGEFAFRVGLPAKSGVSGAVMVVVPGVMGVAIYSPRLDKFGNSVRGAEFCRRLSSRFFFHMYDDRSSRIGKKDLINTVAHDENKRNAALFYAAAKGNKKQVRQAYISGVDLNERDHDGRTPLHLAALAGHKDIVQFLLQRGAKRTIKDARGQTAAALASDAELQSLLK